MRLELPEAGTSKDNFTCMTKYEEVPCISDITGILTLSPPDMDPIGAKSYLDIKPFLALKRWPPVGAGTGIPPFYNSFTATLLLVLCNGSFLYFVMFRFCIL